MNPPDHDRAIEAAREALARIRGVRSVVLFGSAARGHATAESDVDLLIECGESSEQAVRRLLYDLGDRFRVAFGPVFHRREELARFDTQFLESVLRHGRPLIGQPPALTPQQLDLEPLRLVSYRTEALSPRKRAMFLRLLDGYRTEKKTRRRRYVVQKPGFLQRVGGWRVGRGAVVVPEDAAEEFDVLLRRFGATRSMVPIWIQKP